MKRVAAQPPTSLQLARRLLAREAAQGGEAETQVVGAALQQTYLRVSENLRDSLGDDGWTALLVRALAHTDPQHPALQDIRLLDDGGNHLDAVLASVEAHGVAAVTAAVEAVLAALIDILARLIGEDMAIRLIDHDAARPRAGGAGQGP
jgi:hypothetical protein